MPASDLNRVSKVVVLHEAIPEGARPDELDALVQVEETGAALERLDFAVRTLSAGLNVETWLRELESQRPDCVFNLVESLGGDGRLITLAPTILTAARIPYTGCDADAIYLSTNKLLAKHWMMMHGIATPAWFASADAVDRSKGPWIVKSVWEHASLGIDDASVVHDKKALAARLALCRQRFGGEWFAERYIDGREFNISLLEEHGKPRVLPLAEILFEGYAIDKPRIVGYDAKWNSDTVEYRNTPRIFPDLDGKIAQRLETLAKKCWQLFKLRGYARVDIRVDKRGMPWVLEINANPCLASDAGFVAAATRAGIAFDSVITAIMAAATREVLKQTDDIT